MKYTYEFAHPNALHIYECGKLHYMIAIPPGHNRTDIFALTPLKETNSDALIVHTSENTRRLFVHGRVKAIIPLLQPV